jgi:hypothetical protein
MFCKADTRTLTHITCADIAPKNVVLGKEITLPSLCNTTLCAIKSNPSVTTKKMHYASNLCDCKGLRLYRRLRNFSMMPKCLSNIVTAHRNLLQLQHLSYHPVPGPSKDGLHSAPKPCRLHLSPADSAVTCDFPCRRS